MKDKEEIEEKELNQSESEMIIGQSRRENNRVGGVGTGDKISCGEIDCEESHRQRSRGGWDGEHRRGVCGHR